MGQNQSYHRNAVKISESQRIKGASLIKRYFLPNSLLQPPNMLVFLAQDFQASNAGSHSAVVVHPRRFGDFLAGHLAGAVGGMGKSEAPMTKLYSNCRTVPDERLFLLYVGNTS